MTCSTTLFDMMLHVERAVPPAPPPSRAASAAPPPSPLFAPAPRVTSSLGDMFAAGRAAQESRPASGAAPPPDPNVPNEEESKLSAEERQRAMYARLMAEMD